MKRLLSLTLASYMLVSGSTFAARGFGTTDGVATTDVVTTGHTAIATQISYSFWAWRTGAGGGGLARYFDKDNLAAGNRAFFVADADDNLLYNVDWSGTDGQWAFPTALPGTGAWKHFVLVYDGGNVANNPTLYINAVSKAPSVLAAPVGTLNTGSGAYLLGNRNDGIRVFNGRIAEFAVWEGVLLTQTDATNLYNGGAGIRADTLSTTPSYYLPLCGFTSPERNQVNGAANGTATGTLRQLHPFNNCPRGVTTQGAG